MKALMLFRSEIPVTIMAIPFNEGYYSTVELYQYNGHTRSRADY